MPPPPPHAEKSPLAGAGQLPARPTGPGGLPDAEAALCSGVEAAFATSPVHASEDEVPVKGKRELTREMANGIHYDVAVNFERDRSEANLGVRKQRRGCRNDKGRTVRLRYTLQCRG